MREECYVRYSTHEWNVSQWVKKHYVSQGDRALSFFDSTLAHNKKGLRRVVRDSQA